MADNIQFTEILRVACEAASTALAQAGLACVEPPGIEQIAPQERRYESVAAAHFVGVDMRRIILACDQKMEEALLERAAETASGLTWLGELIRAELVSGLGQDAFDQPFLDHDAERFRIRIAGARNFLLRLPTAAGDLLVMIDLQPRSTRGGLFGSETGLGPGTIVEQDSQLGIDDQDVIGKIIKHLAHYEADIEIKVSSDRDRFRLLPATVMEAGFDPENGRFAVTAADLGPDLEEGWHAGAVDIVFFVQQKLLQGSCTVVDLARGYLSENLHLPLLQLRFPELVTYGQRRGAFRIVPPDRLLGSVCRIIGDSGLEVESGSEIPIRVLDVSFTGVRVGISVNTILSGLKWGTPVNCTIDMPSPQRSLHLRGIVRSLILADTTGARGASVGIEFLSNDESDILNLQSLRKYIENYHRKNLGGGVKLEPCRVQALS